MPGFVLQFRRTGPDWKSRCSHLVPPRLAVRAPARDLSKCEAQSELGKRTFHQQMRLHNFQGTCKRQPTARVMRGETRTRTRPRHTRQKKISFTGPPACFRLELCARSLVLVLDTDALEKWSGKSKWVGGAAVHKTRCASPAARDEAAHKLPSWNDNSVFSPWECVHAHLFSYSTRMHWMSGQINPMPM